MRFQPGDKVTYFTPATPAQTLGVLIDAGFTFGQALDVFAARQSDEQRATIALARERVHAEGVIEIDANAVVSGSTDHGDYVLTWVWVDGAHEDDSDGEDARFMFEANDGLYINGNHEDQPSARTLGDGDIFQAPCPDDTGLPGTFRPER